ncbi:MAG TPA: 2-hydroxychromene-2-carboxylate isomerase [Steroidobacteraceae bacterium]|jgi:2-hydroxychromene-2-carboxylate isomerase|nr:2-hydroxychromene-2-carboxylate isomerase [Steroidobacteraceae bacterium]
MSNRALEFWFEFASTYSHVTAQRIEAVARAAGVTVVWKPFLLGPIFRKQGWNDSPFNIYPAKGVYMWQDLERQCAKHGVPFRKPSVFPRPSLLATRIAMTLESSPQRVAEFSRRVFLANFHDDVDTTNDDIVRGVLQSLGWPDVERVLAQAISTETKERLRRRSDEAFERGIFGAPTFLIGSELYWGNDRLEDALTSCVASS